MMAYLDMETTYDGEMSMAEKKPILIEIKKEGIFYEVEYGENILNDFWQTYSRLNCPQLSAHNGVRFDFKFLLSGLERKPVIKHIGSPEHPIGIIFEHDGRTCRWLDTYPKTKARLEQIGEVIGMPKGKFVQYKSTEKIDVNSEKYHELKKYCINDVNILEAHEKFFPDGIKPYQTLASTSFNHLFDVKNIIRMTAPEIDFANRGAMVECYAPELKDAIMLDGNSMYGWAMQKLANPYIYPRETKDRDKNMMGLYYVEIGKSKDDHPFIGIYSKSEAGCSPIPKHYTDGILKYPNFENCRVWLSSGDIDGLESLGYDYTIIKGYEVPVLDLTAKINELFDMRLSREEYNVACKLMLASGYGKFAQRDMKPHKYEIYDEEYVLIGEKMINGVASANERTRFDEYISKNIHGRHKEYYLLRQGDCLALVFDDERICRHRNIITSANILGRARAKLREWDLACGGAAYLDTDALIIPSDNLMYLKRYCGTHLGELKMQDEGNAEIYARKSYMFADKIKCKGISNPHARRTGKFTAEIISDSPRDATFKEMMGGSVGRILEPRTISTDLRNYRNFENGSSKPYVLQNYQEPPLPSLQSGL